MCGGSSGPRGGGGRGERAYGPGARLRPRGGPTHAGRGWLLASGGGALGGRLYVVDARPSSGRPLTHRHHHTMPLPTRTGGKDRRETVAPETRNAAELTLTRVQPAAGKIL